MESGEVSVPDASKPDVQKFHVESRIRHRYAKTIVTSIVANNAAKAQEVVFKITLPESAFISAFQMEIDGKVYKANVKEKETAKKEYIDAVALGQSAAYVEQTVRDSSKFSVSVNVEKTKTVTFKLTYEELLKRELSAYKHVINIDPGQIVPELVVEVYIEESCNLSLLEVPPLQETSELQLNADTEVNTLAKIDRPKPNEGIVRWSPSLEDQKKHGASGVRGQLLVRYDVDRASNPEEILINNGYFVHFFAPSDLPVLRKHVVFVLDVSGSMQGRKIEQMKDAMKTILSNVGSNDFFSLIIFSTDVRVWDPDVIEPLLRAEKEGMFEPVPSEELPEAVVVPATERNIDKAKSFVSCLHDDSATNIHGALQRAIEVAHLGKKLYNVKKISGARPEPMIIFLTDGQPNVGESEPDRITSIITAGNKDAKSALFSLAFGEDADMEFLKKLSLQNCGFARKIYEAADAALQLKQFYRLVASPLLANVQFKYEDKQIVADSVTNTKFRTLFSGSELVVAGRVCSDTINGELVSDSCGVQKSSCLCKPTVMPKREHEFMERLWAYLTIQQLLDNITSDTDVALNKQKALDLALKYSFVTPLTSLVVVKPDESTEAASTERADVENAGVLNFVKKQRRAVAKIGALSSPCFTSSIVKQSLFSEDSMADDVCYDCLVGDAVDISIGDSEVVKCKISSLHVKCNIWCRYASTVMEQVFVNSGDTTQEINFNVYLTLSAVISQSSLSVNGKLKTLRLLSTKDGEESFKNATNADKAAVLVRPNTSDGQRGVTVCVVLPAETTLTFNLQYEEFLEDFGDGYLYTFVLNPGQVVPDLQVAVYVEGYYKLKDVRALHIIPYSPKEEVVEHAEVQFSSAEGHRKAVLSWSPDIAEQAKLFAPDRTMQLGVEYQTEEPCFARGGPAGEVVLDESGQTIHLHLPATVSEQPEKRHLVLVLHVGSTATDEMRELIKAAGRNVLHKLTENDVFSIIICSSDIQVWEDSGSVLSGSTTLGTDRFPATQANITKARDFITQALATIPLQGADIEVALTKALQMSGQNEQPRTKIFVLSAGGTSISESETSAVSARLKKVNIHNTEVFSLACGSTALLTMLRDISAQSCSFACELHKQTVERLLDLFFRVSRFDRISCKVVSQLPKFDGFMERFWLKEAIEQSTADSKLKQSLMHNIATSATSFFAASE